MTDEKLNGHEPPAPELTEAQKEEKKAAFEARRAARIEKIVLACQTIIARSGDATVHMLQQTQLAQMVEMNAIWTALALVGVCDDDAKQELLDQAAESMLNTVIAHSQKIVTPRGRIVQ